MAQKEQWSDRFERDLIVDHIRSLMQQINLELEHVSNLAVQHAPKSGCAICQARAATEQAA